MLGLVLAATCIVITLRVIKPRTMFGLATPIDLGFTGLLVWMFHGTLAGMVGAATGGLALALFLTGGRWLFGYNRFTIKKRKIVRTSVPSPLVGMLSRWWPRVFQQAMKRANS